MMKPINTTPDGHAYAVKASYFKNASLTTLTGGGITSPAQESSSVILLGTYSPTSQMGGRVFSSKGLAPTIMAGTHGYGFGCILEYGEDQDKGSDGERLCRG